jgi:CBS-domain-containing membrane protein
MRDRTDLPLFVCCKYHKIQTAQIDECGSYKGMSLTRTVHPPAGSNPLIIMLSMPKWDFLLFPTLTGAVILVVVAVLFNNLMKGRAYPRYWI